MSSKLLAVQGEGRLQTGVILRGDRVRGVGDVGEEGGHPARLGATETALVGVLRGLRLLLIARLATDEDAEALQAELRARRQLGDDLLLGGERIAIPAVGLLRLGRALGGRGGRLGFVHGGLGLVAHVEFLIVVIAILFRFRHSILEQLGDFRTS